MSSTTILFQAFATDWLGHTSRLIAIAQRVRHLRPEVRSLFVAEGTASMLAESAGFPCVNLPHRQEYAGASWAGWPVDERDALLRSFARGILEQVQPRAVVFDSMPLPCMAEETARARLPAAFVARRSRTPARSFEIAVRWSPMLDLVIAPHDEGEVPVPTEIAGKTHFVGTIVRERPSAGERPGVNRADTRVVITGGGGGYPGTADFYNMAVSAALEAGRDVPNLVVTLVTGPMFREWARLVSRAGVTMVPFDPDMLDTFAAADLVICQGGYNTLAEVVPFGMEVIAVPAPRQADDQFARARSVAAAHAQVTVYEGASARELCRLIVRGLAGSRERRSSEAAYIEPSRGAERAAALILRLADRPERG